MVQLSNERRSHARLGPCPPRLCRAQRTAAADWAMKCCMSVDAWHLFMWMLDRLPESDQWPTQMAAVVLANKMHHTVPQMNKHIIGKWKWRITPARLREEELRVLAHLNWALPSFIMTYCVRGMAGVFPSMQVYDAMLRQSVRVVRNKACLSVVDVCDDCVRQCVKDEMALQFWSKYERGMRSHLL